MIHYVDFVGLIMNKDMRENSKILLEYDNIFRRKPRIAYILQGNLIEV